MQNSVYSWLQIYRYKTTSYFIGTCLVCDSWKTLKRRFVCFSPLLLYYSFLLFVLWFSFLIYLKLSLVEIFVGECCITAIERCFLPTHVFFFISERLPIFKGLENASPGLLEATASWIHTSAKIQWYRCSTTISGAVWHDPGKFQFLHKAVNWHLNLLLIQHCCITLLPSWQVQCVFIDGDQLVSCF